MDIEPTFRGYIQNELDALLIFQAVLDSKLKHVPRRPYEIERPYLITSGNIFVLIEEVSGIKRWTDGITWSPSRISGKFLIYKELDRSFNSPGMFNPMNNNRHQMIPPHYPPVTAAAASAAQVAQAQQVVNPYHQPNYSMQFSKYTGFVKKTISMKLKSPESKTTKQNFHIVSYYLEDDVNYHRLQRPSESPFFNDIKPSDELIKALDTSALGNGTNTTTTSVTTAPSNQQQRYAYFSDRKLIPDELKILNQQQQMQQSLMNSGNNPYHQPMYVPSQSQMWNPSTTNSHTPTNSTTSNNNNNNGTNNSNSDNSSNTVTSVVNNPDGNARYPYGNGVPNSNTLYSVPYNQQQQQIPQNRIMVNNPYQMYYTAAQPSMGGVSHIPKFLMSLNQQPASDANSVNNNNINPNSQNPTTNSIQSSNNNSTNNTQNNNSSNSNNTNTANNSINSNANNESNNSNDVINRNNMYQQAMDPAQQQPYPMNLTNSLSNENNMQQMYPHLPAHVQTYAAYYAQGSILPNNEMLYANNNNNNNNGEPNSDKLRSGYLLDNNNGNTSNGTRLDAMNVPVINTTRMNNAMSGQTVTDSPYETPSVPLTHKGINSSGNTNIQAPMGSSFNRDHQQRQQQQQQQQSIPHPHLPPSSYRQQNP